MEVTRGSVLLVERPESVDRVATALSENLRGEHVETATSVAEATAAVEHSDIVCVCCNLEVPDEDGIEHLRGLDVLEATRRYDTDIPVILYTTAGHEDASRVAIDAGADTHILRCVDQPAFADMARRTQQLANKRRAERRADRHARINEVLRDVNETLVRASTREEIEQSVCQQLVKATQHAHAIYVVEDDGIEIRAESTATSTAVDPAVFEDVELDTSSVWLYNDLDEAPDSLRSFALENSYESMLMLPVLYRDDQYGIVVIFSPTAYAFDKTLWTIFGELGQTIGYAQHAVDTQRELARQNERLDEFARMVSHDLRNPLTIINGRLDLAQETGDAEHFDAINRATERMETLIDDMLRQARSADSDTRYPVALGSVADRAWNQVATGAGTLAIEADCMLQAHPGRLQQLLENLFRNAVEHGSSGDPTTVRTTRQTVGQAESSESGPDDGLTVRIGTLPDGFYVEDNGPGIPNEDRDSIFDYGYSTASENTGYGLAIVHQISVDHGWTIRATDGADGGARFEITGVDF